MGLELELLSPAAIRERVAGNPRLTKIAVPEHLVGAGFVFFTISVGLERK